MRPFFILQYIFHTSEMDDEILQYVQLHAYCNSVKLYHCIFSLFFSFHQHVDSQNTKC